jgi:hypothetical protein
MSNKPKKIHSRNAVPITIRGTLYPSITAAARVFGLNPTTVAKALDTGRLDYVGTGRIAPKPTAYLGVTHPSERAAARANNISVATMQYRMRKKP